MKTVDALAGAMLLCILGVAPAVAHAQPLDALAHLEPGLWQLRVPGAALRNICITDPAVLVQLEHRRGGCSRLVIANQIDSSTVQYSCAAAGWGRTTVRVSTPRSVTVDTQGVAGKAPFAYTAEARRTGECGAMSASLQR